MQVNTITPILNSYKPEIEKDYVNNMAFGVSFASKSKLFEPVKRPFKCGMDKLTEAIAKGLGKIIGKKGFQNLVDKTNDNKYLKRYLVPNLMTLYSIILSGMYVKKTLSNEKLDEQKRKTLAINQGIVWAVSTIMCYTFDNLANKKVDKFIKKFKKINVHEAKLDKYLAGISIAKSMMIFDMVYRFIAPVAVTPLANMIGNKLHEKKQAELAGGKK